MRTIHLGNDYHISGTSLISSSSHHGSGPAMIVARAAYSTSAPTTVSTNYQRQLVGSAVLLPLLNDGGNRSSYSNN
eukprot:scaffold185883_cov33-Cyclotella_meneghiniana.AAC.2